MLVAEGVRVSRGDREILRGVSLSLSPGEVLAVIGPNGAGKSTLLHVLSGALAPGAGTVRFDGRPLEAWDRRELARRRAVLPQATALAFPFRAVDVVLLGRSPHAGRGRRAHDLAIADAVMREVGVAHLAERIYTTLSGGEQQRVQLARVLAQIVPSMTAGGTSCCLMLDEPTSSLDLAHQHAVLATVRALAGRGAAVLAILHDPNLAALHADRIVVLCDGVLTADGTPDAVLTAEVLGHAFDVAVTVARHPTRDRPWVYPA